jgi:xanthine/uracil permease
MRRIPFTCRRPRFESRIQGGLLADGISCCLAGLATVPVVTTFSQNIGGKAYEEWIEIHGS